MQTQLHSISLEQMAADLPSVFEQAVKDKTDTFDGPLASVYIKRYPGAPIVDIVSEVAKQTNMPLQRIALAGPRYIDNFLAVRSAFGEAAQKGSLLMIEGSDNEFWHVRGLIEDTLSGISDYCRGLGKSILVVSERLVFNKNSGFDLSLFDAACEIERPSREEEKKIREASKDKSFKFTMD